MTPRPRTLIPVLAAVAAFAGCGQSSADKAADDVCAARGDIQKQVASLKALPATPASADEVKAGLTAIKDDFGKIADAQPKLADERKKQVQTANDAFKAQLKAVRTDIAQSGSVAAATDQIRDAVAQLGHGYQQALSTGCSQGKAT